MKWLVVAFFLLLIPAKSFAQIVTTMTPDLIAEAIEMGEKDDVPSTRLSKSSGFSWGTLDIGGFTTPFLRVAMAARQAKKEYRKFVASDVTPEMLAPELHIYAFGQANGAQGVSVSAVVITPKKGNDDEKQAKAIQPTRFEPIPSQFQNLLGAKIDSFGRMAVFPLSALSEANEVHVVFDTKARIGVNAAGGTRCADCAVGFSLKRVR